MSRSTPTEDRISSLSNLIICHILSFLPTKHAATTSILSKRWNPLWLSVPTLHFDDETFKDFISFRHFVSSVILLRDNTLPIRSFHIKCTKASNLHLHDINPFVHAVAQRGIENLNLEMSSMVTLPRSILSCRTLVVLHLKGLEVSDLSNVVLNFPLLKSLYLYNVLLEHAEYLLHLLSGCPILEELQAEYLHVHKKEWLVLPQTYFEPEKFQSLPKLITANITKSSAYLTYLLTLLCIAKAQVLRGELAICYLEDLQFHNLTSMEFIFKHNHCEKWNWLLEVLKHCPKLQNLTIHQDFRNGDEVVDNWMNPTIVPECLSTQLTTCCLKGFRCTECELQFAKYIMQNSKVLNTMTIKSASSIDTNAKYHMITKLASSTRASSTCKLLFD